MAAVVQLEEGKLNNGLPPPLRELFLEIQVNKLIKEYLFSSNADERCTSLDDGSSQNKENRAWSMLPNQLFAKDAALGSACHAPAARALADHHAHNPCEARSDLQMQTSQEFLAQHSIKFIEDKGINGQEQTGTGNVQILQGGDAVTRHEATLPTLSVESEGKLALKSAHLSRMDTFPCANKHLCVSSKADTETKASCKKPPLPPPRFPKSELGPSLTRCSSDNGAYLQSLRRAKMERKKKATTAASANTSMWALLFTFCFAMIMIAQGFWSQCGENFVTNGSDTSSPMETFMKASTKESPEDVSLAGVGDRHASVEGALAQSHVIMRKVQSQHLLDMKHLKYVTKTKS